MLIVAVVFVSPVCMPYYYSIAHNFLASCMNVPSPLSVDIISRQGRKMTCICMEWWFSMDDLKLIGTVHPTSSPSLSQCVSLLWRRLHLNTPIERKEFSSLNIHKPMKVFFPQNRAHDDEEEKMMARCYV